MKFHRYLLAAIGLLIAAAASADEFEGKVHMKITTERGTQEMDYWIKPGLVRMNIGANGMLSTMILDFNQRQMTMLMPGRNMYMTRPLPNLPQSAPAQQQKNVSFVKTGETTTILGYTCTKYVIQVENGPKVEMWATDKLGAFGGLAQGFSANRMGSAPPAWAKALAGKEFFPLRVVSETPNGKFTLDITSIEKTHMDDSDFQPPPGYTEFNIGGMLGGGMGGPPPGMGPPAGQP
jgi:hypothetical protein